MDAQETLEVLHPPKCQKEPDKDLRPLPAQDQLAAAYYHPPSAEQQQVSVYVSPLPLVPKGQRKKRKKTRKRKKKRKKDYASSSSSPSSDDLWSAIARVYDRETAGASDHDSSSGTEQAQAWQVEQAGVARAMHRTRLARSEPVQCSPNPRPNPPPNPATTAGPWEACCAGGPRNQSEGLAGSSGSSRRERP